MKKVNFLTFVLLAVCTVGFFSASAEATFTVATFSDPSINSDNPLFTVNFTAMTINGGWADSETDLTLEIPYSSASFADVWFEMTEVTILNALGDTSGGVINFYADGTVIDPLLTINFTSGYVDNFNLGADEMFVANNVTISGIGITPGSLTEEEFSFSFANKADLLSPNEGFTATASFTSSAVPEPATIALLCIGVLSLIRRKK